jgi:valyl-tRNA synthetase
MMMMGLHFMGDVPFRDVYIHALVRDAEGKKMSKSTGNIIDPLEVIDQYGTDAFRFTLAALAAQGRDIKLSEDRISGYRHFVNKIWNSARLVLMNLDEDLEAEAKDIIHGLPERWILTRLGQVSDEMAQAIDEYRFNDAATLCYQFVWHEFCDWYLEMAKPALYGEDESLKRASRFVLQESLAAVLRLIHPFMPFATEEIWQRLPASQGSIMAARFPQASDFISDPQALKEMDLVIGVITGVRNIRGEMNIGPSKRVDIVIEMPDENEANIIRQNMVHVQNLAKVDSVSIESKVPKPEASATAVFGQNQIHVLLKGILDFNEERKRLRKEIKKIEKDMEMPTKKLSKREFVEKAPPEIVDKVRTKAESMRLKLDKLNQNLNFFESIEE